MKHLLTLLVVLGLAAGANAALLTDDFNDGDISDWTVQSGSGWDVAASGVAAEKMDVDDTLSTITKSFAPQSSGTVTLELDITVSGNWRPVNFALTDSTGTGVALDCYAGDYYNQIGAGTTSDYGTTMAGMSVVDGLRTAMSAIKYVLNIGTGEVTGYVNGALQNTVTVDMTGVGDISVVGLTAKKKVTDLDNVVVTPEPASLALLGMGGLALLRRRR